jgi:hypothetical protein
MNRSKLDALWHEAEEKSRNEGAMYSRYHFAALVLANTPPQSSMSWQEGYEAGKLAKREWVGLTDEEIQTIWRNSEHMTTNEVCRAIEAKLKEKNT